MRSKHSDGSLVVAGLVLAAGLLALGSPAFAQGTFTQTVCANTPCSPTMNQWVDPLPVPPVAAQTKKPLVSVFADYYEINMTAHPHRFNSGLPGDATVWTYGQPGKAAVLLGPTIVATSGRPVMVKYINNLPTALADFPLKDAIDQTIMGWDVPTGAATPHLHGGHTAARYDGTPSQWWTADGKRGMDYVTDTMTYMNDQPASLIWYHDHTMGSTRFKPYLGLAAGYVIFDKVDTGTTIVANGKAQNVPSGYGTYHLPLVIQDKQFNADGTLFYPSTPDPSLIHPIWVPEFFGDTPVINGKAYPKLDAEPRRYRLRLLNGSQARFYNLGFKSATGLLTFYVIGSEGGLLPAPVAKTSLLIAPGERFDVIVDFAPAKGGTVMLTNDSPGPYPMGDPANDNIPELMKINVGSIVTVADTSVDPAKLKLPAIAKLTATAKLPARDVVLKENHDALGNPYEVLLNGYHFMDPTTDFVKAGTTETWQWINLTVDTHPMHPHLVAFQVVNRQPFDAVRYDFDWNTYVTARNAGIPATKPDVNSYLINPSTGLAYPIEVPAPEEAGFKDTVKAPPSYVTRTIARFTLPTTALLDYNAISGSYGNWVYHCHILEHEENDMMRPFVVVK
ncbi:MAG: multicopper oxidase domain-containing protein [Acidobacteriota bacterium]